MDTERSIGVRADKVYCKDLVVGSDVLCINSEGYKFLGVIDFSSNPMKDSLNIQMKGATGWFGKRKVWTWKKKEIYILFLPIGARE